MRNSKRNFEKKLANSTNKKPFNSYLRSKTKSRSGVGPIVHDNRVVTEAKEMSTILNSYFSSVFVADIDGSQVPDPAEKVGFIPVSSIAITKLIIAQKIDNLRIFVVIKQ